MHVLAWIALALPFLGIALVVGGPTGVTPVGRTAFAALRFLPFILSIALTASLAFAQRPICDLLGGRWIRENSACQDEWGGNGNNDPSNGGFILRPDEFVGRRP